ncbi:MAG: hypothetical protein FWC65_00855 [Treponema sp.]|nr:hypothetical protein [Treponema sp.]
MKKNCPAGNVCLRPFIRVFFAALLFCFAALPLKAEPLDIDSMEAVGFFNRLSWFAQGSIMFFLEGNDTADSDPMPILPSPGVGAAYPFSDTIRLELALDFYTTHYGFSHALNRPVPLADENRTSRVLGFVLSFQAARLFDITPDLTLRAFGGLAADIRVVLVAARLHPTDPQEEIRRQTTLVRQYFWSGGRWLLPVAGIGADYTLESGLRLGLDFRVWVPAYRLWTGENLPAAEGWRLGPTLRLTFR